MRVCCCSLQLPLSGPIVRCSCGVGGTVSFDGFNVRLLCCCVSCLASLVRTLRWLLLLTWREPSEMARYHSNRNAHKVPTSVSAPAFVVVSPLLQDEEWFDNEAQSKIPASVLLGENNSNDWDEPLLPVDPAPGATPVPAAGSALTAAFDFSGSADLKRARGKAVDAVDLPSSRKRKVSAYHHHHHQETAGVQRREHDAGAVKCCWLAAAIVIFLAANCCVLFELTVTCHLLS